MPWRSWRPGWPACAGAWAPSRSTSSSAAAACPRSPASGQVLGCGEGRLGVGGEIGDSPGRCGGGGVRMWPLPSRSRRGSPAAPGTPSLGTRGPRAEGPPPPEPCARARGQKSGTGTEAGPGQFFGPARTQSVAEAPRPPRRASLSRPRSDPRPGRAPSVPLSPASHLGPPASLGPRTLSSHRRRPPAQLGSSWDPSCTFLPRPREQSAAPGGQATSGRDPNDWPSRRACPQVPGPPPHLVPLPRGPGVLPMGLCMGTLKGTPGGCTE